MGRKNKIEKWIDLSGLPRCKGYDGKRIDWIKSIGLSFRFSYENIDGQMEILNYKKKNQRLSIKYKDEVYEIATPHLLECKLGDIVGVKTSKFLYNINEKLGDLIIIDREHIIKNGTKYKCYKIKCLKCGFDSGEHYKNDKLVEEYWITESVLKRHGGCPCCCSSPNIVVRGINDMWTTNWDLANQLQNIEDGFKYSENSNRTLNFKCPKCGEIISKKVSVVNCYGLVCSQCSDGEFYSEKFLCKLFKLLNIKFKTQYSPIYLKNKRSDFYIPHLKLVVEVDGGLGHGCKVFNKHKKTDEEIKRELFNSVEIDKWKDEQHLKHGVNTIRISYDDKKQKDTFVNNIFDSNVLFYLNVSSISSDIWNECDIYANGSKVKEVCDYYNCNNITLERLGEIFNLNRNTVSLYLRKGNLNKWCDYDSNKGKSLVGKLNSKKVEIFKDGVSLGVFESATELERQSKELFGVRLFQSCISRVCVGKQKHHNAYTFKYVEDYKEGEINEGL